MLRRRCALGFVDKGAIGARNQDVDGFLAAFGAIVARHANAQAA